MSRRVPDFGGVADRRAWVIRARPKGAAPHVLDPTEHMCLGHWLVDCPHTHPAWHWWTVVVLDLQDVPGVPKAKLQYPDARYELLMMALDPQRCPEPDPDEAGDGYPFLLPVDLAYQFHGVDRDTAAHIGELAVKTIMTGQLAPDSDYASAWAVALARTIERFKNGTAKLPPRVWQ